MASPGRQYSQDIYTSPVTSAYPFPQIDPTLRNKSFSRPIPRRGSTASSVLSFGAGQDGYAVIAESGPNAISALLQPPILRTGLQPHNATTTSGFKAPNQRDIPPVTLTNIRHVEAKTFHPYLSQVGSLYEAFQRAKNETETGEVSLFQRDKKDKSEDWETILSKRLQRPPHSRQDSSVSTVSAPSEKPQPRRRSSGQKRNAVTPLSTIPSVYSEEDFHLENPRTFDVVSERSEIVRDPSATPTGRKSLATNAILQEKLSWYMDTVEVHLISSISTASKSFFSALGELRELHAEAEESVVRIQKLRKELARLDKEMAVDGLKVVNLKQRRDNVRRLGEAVLQLQDVVLAVQSCEDSVKSENLDRALDDIQITERLMAGEADEKPYAPQDLRRLRALDGAVDELNRLRSQIGRGYESRFHGTLLGDVRRHASETEASETLQRWGTAFNRPKPGQRRTPSNFATYMKIAPGFREELESEMRGLSRAKFTTPAVTTFRALILREMKSMIRKQLPSSNDDDTVSTISASTYGGRKKSQQEKSSILARNLRALDDADWYHMLVKIYTGISESLRRLSVQVKILLDITSAIDHSSIKSPPLGSESDNKMLGVQAGRPRSVSIQMEIQQALDLSNLLGEAVDAAHSQIVKVLKVRSQQNSDMPLKDFIQYFTLNKLFADECEAISGRSGAILKSTVDAQIKEFVAQFGNRERHSLVQTMDSDKWDAKDFGEQENVILARIIEGSTSDAASWSEIPMIWQAQATGSTPTTHETNGAAKVRSAAVDEQKYILSESPIAMLHAMEQFQILATGIPSIGSEVANSLLETLKIFNSRASQLILGAGATRSAGLRNITTKHLALSSQGLSFMVALVPYVREFFRRHVPSSTAMQSMTEFDKVKRLFQEHQHGIHEKLVEIMSIRSSIHVKTMKSLDWEEVEKASDGPASAYMDTLTRETATLHRVLSKHLPKEIVLSIMIPVFDAYKKQWEPAFREVELKSEVAKARLLAHAQALQARLGRLEGGEELGQTLVDVAQARTITGNVNHATAAAGSRTSAEIVGQGEQNSGSSKSTGEKVADVSGAANGAEKE